MDLSVYHVTRYRYASPARQVVMRLRLLPRNLAVQEVLDWAVTVDGRPVTGFPANAFGDGEGFALARGPIEQVEVVARGLVRTTDRHGLVSGFGLEAPLPVFLRSTLLTRGSQGLAELAQEAKQPNPLPSLHRLTNLVRERIAYAPGSTTAGTPAAVALEQGKGVCQDQTHAFIAAARLLGVPARYVAGYLLLDGEGPGSSETHAWAEAWVEGLGWVGFDPTHGMCVTERYIRLCCGLDADDGAPIKGSVWDAEAIGVRADVIIEDAGPEAGLQRQQQQ